MCHDILGKALRFPYYLESYRRRVQKETELFKQRANQDREHTVAAERT
jgi:hypothetical protein